MMARRGRKNPSVAVWSFMGLAALVSMWAGGWGCLAVVVVGTAAIWLLVGRSEQPEPSPRSELEFDGPLLVETPAVQIRGSGATRRQMRRADDDELVPVRVSQHAAPEFKVPPAPRGFGQGRWLPAGESIVVQGLSLRRGLFYVGNALPAASREVDPCLIDPSKPVASAGDFTQRQTDYWPSYSSISPSARRAYLEWLAGGREHPEADVGYVFLFFYGLERRVLIDARNDRSVEREFPSIALELRRLLQLYGGASRSFRHYAGTLLDWVELSRQPPLLYLKPVTDLPSTGEVPFSLRVAIGQAAVDGSPLPASLALAWTKHEPSIRLRTAAKRCAGQFARLFEQKYAAMFGTGLVLTPNRTRLKFFYRPASAGFLGAGEFVQTFGGLPDVTALTGPIRKLQDLAEATTSELEPFSRLIGRQPAAGESMEGLALLPATLWPSEAQEVVASLRARMGDGLLRLSCSEFLSLFGATTVPPRARLASFLRALEASGLGFEPDVLGRARPPKSDESVVVFETTPSDARLTGSAAYLAAELTLQVASSVAAADGTFGEEETRYLHRQIDAWHHLGPNQQRRLRAHLSLLGVEPESATALRKKLEPLDQRTRETIASIIANLAQSDGVVTPTEVRMLEKAYRALGVDPKRVFSDLHGAAVKEGAPPPTAVDVSKQGFKLDPARIAQLQEDTNRVSALLSGIFSESESEPAPSPPVVPEPQLPEEREDEAPSILGLDARHSAFAQLLLSRPHWSRAELLDVAADMELMLDGALEHINEAAFESFDLPLMEGEDPLEVNVEVVKRLET